MHADADPFQMLVGPSTLREFNTVRLRLKPVACWRLDDIRFKFYSSFLRPEVAREVQHLFELREKHRKVDEFTKTTRYPPLSIFGHAGPVGDDDYNKTLSGRRAKAIYFRRCERASGRLGRGPACFI